MRTLLLIGGGHTHTLLLRRIRPHLDSDTRILLVSPERFAPYSAMLPGLIAGHYRYRDCHTDLGRLCEDADATLICARVERLDLQARRAHLNNGDVLDFDLVSINSGIESAPIPAGAEEHSLSVKPVSDFLPNWQRSLERLYQHKEANVAVVGGGSTAVEMAMAVRHRLDHDPRITARVDIHLLHAGGTLLPDEPLATQLHVVRQLQQTRIRVHPLFNVTHVEEGELLTERRQHIPADEIIWCIQGTASRWPGESGLATNDQGLIQVNRHLQSVSHPFVFAAGDIASITDQPLPRAGVYAVRQAPVLTDNLVKTLLDQSGKSSDKGTGKLRSFRGQKRFLSIISCGDQYAVARRGNWVLAGKWVWKWKRWLDRRFMKQFPHP